MLTRTFIVGPLAAVLVASCLARPAPAAQSGNALWSYLNGQAEMQKATAAVINAQAALVKSISEAQLNYAKTIDSLQTTRTKALENDLKVATNFYEKRKLYDAYQSLQTDRERPDPEDLMRYSREAAPERPDGSQLDRGVIHWPDILQREEFTDARIQLDILFVQRYKTQSGPGSDVYRDVRKLTDQMRLELKDMVQQLSPVEYMAAKRFIDSLAYEAQLPPEIPGVALR